jgi:hypothetical protein
MGGYMSTGPPPRFAALILVGICALVLTVPGLAGSPPPPAPSGPHGRSFHREPGYAFGDAAGDSVFTLGDSLEWFDPTWAPTITGRDDKEAPAYVLGRKSHRPREFGFMVKSSSGFMVKSSRTIVVFGRPVRSLMADTSNSDEKLVAEYYLHPLQAQTWDYPGPWGWTAPDTGSALHLVVWIAHEDDYPPSSEKPRTAQVVGALIIDPVANRVVWTRGGRRVR